MHVERFAPSPTGLLHLGGAFSAFVARDRARAREGRFLVRMEDIDRDRCRPEHGARLLEDLAWLGIVSDGPVLWQSGRIALYRAALDGLTARGLTYPCTCTRKDIAAAASAPQEGQPGPDGPVYPGRCRRLGPLPGRPAAVRLDMARAIEALGGDAAVDALGFDESGDGVGRRGRIALDAAALRTGTGDVVLWRKDPLIPAYHLAVVVDDAAQGVTCVTRGADLAPAAPLHRLLQALLGLPAPGYHHHRLIRDERGRRLAKRDDARAIATLRDAGWTAEKVRTRLGLG